jgi:hypothetical protein
MQLPSIYFLNHKKLHQKPSIKSLAKDLWPKELGACFKADGRFWALSVYQALVAIDQPVIRWPLEVHRG